MTKDEPVAWGMEKDGLILDVICPDEHEREEGGYTIPLYTTPQREYEQGFIDGMQKQMQSSVDKAVNAMGKREWVGLTDFEKLMLDTNYSTYFIEKTDKEKNVTYVGKQVDMLGLFTAVEKILKERNT
jgi:hypothetical protein